MTLPAVRDAWLPSGGATLRRRLVVGAGWSLAGRLAVAVLGVVASALLTRLLTPADVGRYVLASSIVGAWALVAGLGVNQVVVRRTAHALAYHRGDQARAVVQAGFRLGLSVACAGALAYAIAGPWVGRALFGDPVLAGLSLALGCWVLVLAVQPLVTESFRGLADIRAATLFGGPLAALLVTAALLVVALTGSRVTLTQVTALSVAAATVTVLVGAGILRRAVTGLPAPTRRTGELRHRAILAVALPLVSSTLLSFVLGAADLWIVGAVSPPADVATYGVAARTATVVGMPLLVVYGVLPPVVARLLALGDRGALQRVLGAAAMVAAVPAGALALVFLVAGAPLLAAVYGAHYAAGGRVLGVLALGQAASAFCGACGLTLAMAGRHHLLLGVNVLVVATTIAALLVVVPWWGMLAGATVAALGLAGQNVAMLVAARWATGVWTHASPAAMATVLLRGAR